jgi:hypothetical protein
VALLRAKGATVNPRRVATVDSKAGTAVAVKAGTANLPRDMDSLLTGGPRVKVGILRRVVGMELLLHRDTRRTRLEDDCYSPLLHREVVSEVKARGRRESHGQRVLRGEVNPALAHRTEQTILALVDEIALQM